MDIEALRTFLAIHRAGGFSAATGTVHRSQPAISRRVALLERELGAPLFERTAGNVVLSQAGQVLLPHAERAVAAMEDCAAAIQALRSGDAGPVDVAVVGTLAEARFAAILKRFAAARPGVGLTLRTANSAEISELVRQGAVTIGLRYHHDPASDLSCERIASERLVVVCGGGHRLVGSRLRSLLDLAEEQWLAFPTAREMSGPSHLLAQFLVRGVPEVKWTPVDSLTAQKRLVEARFGIALLPQSAVAEELANGSLTALHVADLDAANPICLVVRRQGYLSPAARALLTLLRSELAEQAPETGSRRRNSRMKHSPHSES